MPAVPRRSRGSVPNAAQPGLEDVSSLSLSEVRSRLERNARVLNTSLFSTSPTSPSVLSTSPSNNALPPSFRYSAPGQPGSRVPAPSLSPSSGSSATTTTTATVSPVRITANPGGDRLTSPLHTDGLADPVREKLLVARQALLDREQELLAKGMETMGVQDDVKPDPQTLQAASDSSIMDVEGAPVTPAVDSARRRSETGSPALNLKSGKARALETIQAGEGSLAPGGIILPYAETLALGARDFDNATASKIANMSLDPCSSTTSTPRTTAPSTPRHANGRRRPRVRQISDEIARAETEARMRAFIGYKGDEAGFGSDVDFDLEEMYDHGDVDVERGVFTNWTAEGEYDGDQGRFALENQGREAHRSAVGTGEEVDEEGEDDEMWAEGNDEYLDRVG